MTVTHRRTTSALGQIPMQTVLIQAGLTGLSALAFALIGWDQALAALLAGACVCSPGIFVARQFIAPPATAEAELAVGEGKTIGAAMAGLIATLILMGCVFAFLKPPALGFFATLALTQVAPLIAATLQDRRRAKALSHRAS